MFAVSSVIITIEAWLTMTTGFGSSISSRCLLFEGWLEDSTPFLPKLKAIFDWLRLASPVDSYINSDNNDSDTS